MAGLLRVQSSAYYTVQHRILFVSGFQKWEGPFFSRIVTHQRAHCWVNNGHRFSDKIPDQYFDMHDWLVPWDQASGIWSILKTSIILDFRRNTFLFIVASPKPYSHAIVFSLKQIVVSMSINFIHLFRLPSFLQSSIPWITNSFLLFWHVNQV
jgi:hypothetical protein